MTEPKNHMIRVQDEKLFTQAKIYAAKSGMTLVEIAEESLKLFFSKKSEKKG